MSENPTLGTPPLRPGDRVEFPGYGIGVVEAAGPMFLWIDWPEIGESMRHYTTEILPHLRRVTESGSQ